MHIGKESRQYLRDSYTAGAVSLSKKYARGVMYSALARVEKYYAFLTCVMEFKCSIHLSIVHGLFGLSMGAPALTGNSQGERNDLRSPPS
jgi:hypothetical protein